MRMTAGLLAVTLVGSTMLAAASVTSRWKDSERAITIDGRISDWTELISYEQRVSVAASNDEHTLYLAIATNDAQRRRQLLAAGLIVWLDATGGKKERYGIRIPGALEGLAGEDRPIASSRARGATGAEPLQPEFTYIELRGPGDDDRRRLELSAATGLGAAARVENGTLLYELKIPIAAGATTERYALMTRGRSLGLGLQTPKIEGLGVGQRGSGRGGMGGMGRGRSGGGRGGGAGRGGARARGMDQLDDLKLWTTITLAIARPHPPAR